MAQVGDTITYTFTQSEGFEDTSFGNAGNGERVRNVVADVSITTD